MLVGKNNFENPEISPHVKKPTKYQSIIDSYILMQ